MPESFLKMTEQRPTSSPNPNYPPRRQRRRFSPRKAARLFLPLFLFIGLCVVLCTPSGSEKGGAESNVVETPKKFRSVAAMASYDSTSHWTTHLQEMPSPTEKIHVNYFGNVRKVFNDSNYIHLQEAELYGIEPLTDTRSHWRLRSPIVKMVSCRDFFVDSLRHSRPYLVPVAAGRLHEIGRRFRDTLQTRGGGDYRIKVTSLLRTPRTVKRLRRVNRNAVDTSVHQYGTTFDISYAVFIADGDSPARSVDDLKGILSEVLKAMREEGKLWVKYERGQPCFHITARLPVEAEDRRLP